MENKEDKEDIWKFFDTLNWSVKLGEHAGRADQMFCKSLKEGRENNDLDKIYEFIEANERGCGLRKNLQVCQMFRMAYEEGAERLCRILAERNDIADYWMYLSTCCETDMIIAFTGMDVGYPRFYYECARLLLKEAKVDKRCEEGVIAATQKIARMDLELWERWLRKNQKNSIWQKLLFPVLAGIGTKGRKVFCEIADLDMDDRNHESDILAQGFASLPDDSKNQILAEISNDLIERWNTFIAAGKKSGRFLERLLISEYFNLLLNAIWFTCGEKDKWKKLFLQYSKVLEEDMCNWYESESRLKSTFFFDMTQIYHVLIVGQECHLIENDECTRNCIQTITELISQYDYFWRRNEQQKKLLLDRLKDPSFFV